MNIITSSITVGIVLLILGTFLFYYIKLKQKCRASCNHTRFYNQILESITPETLANERRDILQKAMDNPEYGPLWQDFDATLVSYSLPNGGHRLCRTVDAAEIFNADTLSHGLSGNRLLAAVPAFLTAIGIIGTFLGLTLGMLGLQLNQEGTSSLSQGIRNMISGASMAFITSVCGVFFSLVFNFIEKRKENQILNDIFDLQNRIDRLFTRFNPDKYLASIANSTSNSQKVLQGLAEQIGNRFQETLNTGMDRALNSLSLQIENIIQVPTKQYDKIFNEMSELLDSLNKTARNSSEYGNKLNESSEEILKVFKSIDGVASGITKAVDGLNTSIQNTNTSIQNTFERTENMATINSDISKTLSNFIKGDENGIIHKIVEISDRLAEVTVKIDKFIINIEPIIPKVQEINRQFDKLTGKFQDIAEPIHDAGKELNEASSKIKDGTKSLNQISDALKNATDKLSGDIGEAAKLTSIVSSQNHETSENFHKSLEGYKNLTADMGKVANHLESATEKAKDGFASVEQCGESIKQNVEYLDSLVKKTLDSYIDELSEQVSKLLEGYAHQVQTQTTERLNEWNEQTSAYTRSMIEAIKTLNAIVDEIEGKLGRKA